jgi:DnaK suppressor protein
MNKTKLASLRTALDARRDEITTELERLGEELQWLGADQENERGGLGNHLAEDGSSVMEQERITTLADDLRDSLRQVEAALARMDEGTYGICQRCGKPINEERLEAFPYVEYCIDCQSFLERQHALYGHARRVG